MEKFILEDGKVYKIREIKEEASNEEAIAFLMGKVQEKDKAKKEVEDFFKGFRLYYW